MPLDPPDAAVREQKALEGLALSIGAHPDLAAPRAEALALFRAHPQARERDWAASLQDAADQHFWGAILLATNLDPHHPRICPVFMYAHQLDGQAYPSALHGGLENPDNVYRVIPVSPDSRYELRGRRHSPAPAQITYELMDSVPGVAASIGHHIALLNGDDMALGPDGAFTLTLDGEPAGGRPNHLQLTAETRALFVRDSLSDWTVQDADSLEITRVAGPDAAPWSEDRIRAEAVRLVPHYARFWLDIRERYVDLLGVRLNEFVEPAPRTGAWGFIANTHFQIGPDEAFVFTTDPSPAAYHAALIGNHWWIAMDAQDRSGAFNTSQVAANADGTITFVIAASDPGAHNWLDTGGLGEGIIQVRWQGTSPGTRAIPDAVRAWGVVKLADLREHLPPETTWLDGVARRAQLQARAQSYRRRLGQV